MGLGSRSRSAGRVVVVAAWVYSSEYVLVSRVRSKWRRVAGGGVQSIARLVVVFGGDEWLRVLELVKSKSRSRFCTGA